MTEVHVWREMVSEVYRPGRWLGLSVGTVFLLIGAVGGLGIGGLWPAGAAGWIVGLGAAVFALLGVVVFGTILGGVLRPARVRHASPDVLPNVSTEPVSLAGSVVHGRLTHELSEEAQAWQFRPAGHLWRNDKRFLFGFGAPFLLFFAGLLTWVFHTQQNIASWFVSAAYAIAVTALCGGSAFLLIGMMMRSGYRRLCRLSIPRDGSDLELDSPEEPKLEQADLLEGLTWVLLGATKRQRLTIPRALVQAVQLCPWKFVLAGSGQRQITWAVQGLIVLASSGTEYRRLPILLTGDCVGAARLMQRLAETLRVPYLFSADAAGWRTETARAKTRPSLRAGGMMT